MRFSVDCNVLTRACTNLADIAAMRTVIPILNNVKLEAAGGKLTITANNLDQSMAITVQANVEAEGATTVEYRRLQSIASIAAEGADIFFSDEREEGRAEIKTGKSRYKLLTLPAADYPVFEMPEQTLSVPLRGAELERLLSVWYAAADEEARPYLNGIYVHRTTDGLGAVATDGHRLALVEIDLPEGAEDIDRLGVILPNATVKILRRLVSDDRALFETDDRKVVVTFERAGMVISFVSKLIEGTYPDFGRTIPARQDGRTVSIATDPLITAVKRAMIAQDGKSSSVRLLLNEGRLSLSARSDAGIEAADTVDCDWAGEEFELFLNGRYLLASVNGLDAKEVELTVKRADYPVRMEIPGVQGRTDVIMTMRG
jgi:DNA polymerase-3 subunit beta